MKNLLHNLIPEDIFFVTPDVKRAIGIEDLLPSYHIICSYNDPLIPILRKKGTKIFCLEEILQRDVPLVNNSGSLLSHPLIVKYINSHSHSTPHIMYFKPSVKIDFLIKTKGYRAIGNNFSLNEQFENKIKFFEFSHKYFPKFSVAGKVGMFNQFEFQGLSENLGLPLVVQFGHGWAGKTTYFIKTKKEFTSLSKKFPKTVVKVTKKIDGYTVLNNCCVYKDSVLIGPPAIQISDIPELYPKPAVTCGRQWPVKFLNKKEIDKITDISKKVGRIMMKAGYKGFFGLDFLADVSLGQIYLSEINARLTASANFYTYLENGLNKIPLAIYHIASFLKKNVPYKEESSEHIVGSQLIFRKNIPQTISPSTQFGVFKLKKGKPIFVRRDYLPNKLENNEFIYIKRERRDEKETGEEISRIETKREILLAPHKLNPWIKNLL
jgi:hypothetical protein